MNTLLQSDDDAQRSVSRVLITPNYDEQTVQISVQRPEGYEPEVHVKKEVSWRKNPKLAYKRFMFRWYPDFSKYFWKTPVEP